MVRRCWFPRPISTCTLWETSAAIAEANNLLVALVDNHIHHGNELGIDPRAVGLRRAIDVNDRTLRTIITSLGGRANGVVRETGFDITAASQIMAVLCLAESPDDLKDRLARIVIGDRFDGAEATVADLGVQGSLTAILASALAPNLVQTLEGTPAFAHGGPFANIAHRMQQHYRDEGSLGHGHNCDH